MHDCPCCKRRRPDSRVLSMSCVTSNRSSESRCIKVGSRPAGQDSSRESSCADGTGRSCTGDGPRASFAYPPRARAGRTRRGKFAPRDPSIERTGVGAFRDNGQVGLGSPRDRGRRRTLHHGKEQAEGPVDHDDLNERRNPVERISGGPDNRGSVSATGHDRSVERFFGAVLLRQSFCSGFKEF